MKLTDHFHHVEDQRTIANRLAAQSKEDDPSSHHNRDIQPEAELSKKDPLKPVSCLRFKESNSKARMVADVVDAG
jgi:hypothetical protein